MTKLENKFVVGDTVTLKSDGRLYVVDQIGIPRDWNPVPLYQLQPADKHNMLYWVTEEQIEETTL
jgi:hypothetical protein